MVICAAIWAPAAACDLETVVVSDPDVLGTISGQVLVDGVGGLPGVTVSLTGAFATPTTPTDATGGYRFERVAGGSYTVAISDFAPNITFSEGERSASVSVDGEHIMVDFQGSFGPLLASQLCNNNPPPTVATFVDPDLHAAIRSAVSVGDTEDVTCELLAGLTALDASGGDISILVGIENLTSLTALSLADNSISEIASLSALTRLATLDMAGNSITNIVPLGGLTGLTDLHLEGNSNLSNIQPLIDNTGLGSGGAVDLRLTSVACVDVAALAAKGVTVTSDCG